MHVEEPELLVEEFRRIAPDALRLVLRYEGDEYDLVYVRDDVRELYSPEEFDEKLKQLVVEGLTEQPNQAEFRMFGELSVTIRRFNRALILHFPIDQFTGVAVTFDVDEVSSIDEIVAAGIRWLDETQ